MNIALEGTERKANWLRKDADGLCRYARMLADLPDYETQAAAAINEAEAALSEALLAVKLAKSEFNRKSNRVTEGVPQ